MNSVEILIRARDQFSDVTKKARKEFASLGDTAKSLLGVAAATTAVAGVMAAAIKKAADYGDEINDMRQKTGLAAEDLSVLKYAANQTGTSFEEIAKAIRKAQIGVYEGSAAFKALGVEIKGADGQTRPFQDILGELFDRFSKMPDGIEKTALAVKVFGKAGDSMIPFLNEGPDGLKRFRDEAEELGLVIGNDAAAAADQFNDSLARLEGRIDGLVVKFGNYLIPGINVAIDKIGELVRATALTGNLADAVGGDIARNIQEHGLAGWIGTTPDGQTDGGKKSFKAGPSPEAQAAAKKAETERQRDRVEAAKKQFKDSGIEDLTGIVKDAWSDPDNREAMFFGLSVEGTRKLSEEIRVLRNELMALEQDRAEWSDKERFALSVIDMGEERDKAERKSTEYLKDWLDKRQDAQRVVDKQREKAEDVAQKRQEKYWDTISDAAGEVWDAFEGRGQSVLSNLASLAKGYLNTLLRMAFQAGAVRLLGGGGGSAGGGLGGLLQAGGLIAGGKVPGFAGGFPGVSAAIGAPKGGGGLLGAIVGSTAPIKVGMGGYAVAGASSTTLFGMTLATAIPVLGLIAGGIFGLTKILGHKTQEAKFYEDPMKNGSPARILEFYTASEFLRGVEMFVRHVEGIPAASVVTYGMKAALRDDRTRTEFRVSMLGDD